LCEVGTSMLRATSPFPSHHQLAINADYAWIRYLAYHAARFRFCFALA